MTLPSSAQLPAKRWLSPAEAAEYLGVTDRTIRNYAKNGVLTTHHIGPKLVRFDREQIDRTLTGGAS